MFNALESIQAFEAGKTQRKDRERETAMKSIGNALAGGDITGAASQAFAVDPMYGMQIQQYGDGRNALALRKDIGGLVASGDRKGAAAKAYGAGELEMGANIDAQIAQMTQQQRQDTLFLSGELGNAALTLQGITDPQQRLAQWQQMQSRFVNDFGMDPATLAQFDPTNDADLDDAIGRAQTFAARLEGQRADRAYDREGEYRTQDQNWREQQAAEARRQFNSGKMRPASPEELAKYNLPANAPYMVDGMGQLHLIEGADDYTAAGRARSSATVPGFPAPTTVTDGLPAGVIGTYARGDESTIEAARKAAATSRERATLTGQFVDKAEGYLAQGEGFFNDLGQVLSMRTSGLNQLTNKLGPQSRPENSGSTSDKDMGVYMQSTVNVNNTPGTNKDIAAMEAAIAERDQAYLQWVQDYSAAYPSPGSTRDAKRLWDQYTYADENRMFSVGKNGRVTVKRPPPITEWLAEQEDARAAKAEPVRIFTDEEYDALPADALYVGPDGVRRTK